MVDFFLVAEQHVISIFIFLALFLDIIQFFARHELRLFFEFVGQEKVPKRVAFMACEECCQFWDFGVSGDEDIDFRELFDVLFHEDDGEVSVFCAWRETYEIFVDVGFHLYLLCTYYSIYSMWVNQG